MALVLLGACSAEVVPTQVIVAIDADPEVAEKLTSLDIVIYDPVDAAARGADAVEHQRREFFVNTGRASPGTVTFPFSVGVKKGRSQDFLVVVTGKVGKQAVIEHKALVSFVDGEVRGLGIYLASPCLDQLCASDDDWLTTCRAQTGSCEAVEEQATTPVKRGAELDAGLLMTDGVGPSPAGPRDAGPGAMDARVTTTTVNPVAPVTPTNPGMTTTPSAPASDSGPGGADATSLVDGGPTSMRDCCPDGNCLCHGPVPSNLSGLVRGPFKTATLQLSSGTVYYPVDAEGPFAGLVMGQGVNDSDALLGVSAADWGAFYGSFGIVAVDVGADVLYDSARLLAALDALKMENLRDASPLYRKMSDRYGISVWDASGNSLVTTSAMTPSLKSSVGIFPVASRSAAQATVPNLLLCVEPDPDRDPCTPIYTSIPNSTSKMRIDFVIDGDRVGGLVENGLGGLVGGWALAFQKVFLEGDLRWKPLLLARPPPGATVTTNITP